MIGTVVSVAIWLVIMFMVAKSTRKENRQRNNRVEALQQIVKHPDACTCEEGWNFPMGWHQKHCILDIAREALK